MKVMDREYIPDIANYISFYRLEQSLQFADNLKNKGVISKDKPICYMSDIDNSYPNEVLAIAELINEKILYKYNPDAVLKYIETMDKEYSVLILSASDLVFNLNKVGLSKMETLRFVNDCVTDSLEKTEMNDILIALRHTLDIGENFMKEVSMDITLNLKGSCWVEYRPVKQDTGMFMYGMFGGIDYE